MEKIKFRILVKMENVKTFSDSDSKGVGGFSEAYVSFSNKTADNFSLKIWGMFPRSDLKADPVS